MSSYFDSLHEPSLPGDELPDHFNEGRLNPGIKAYLPGKDVPDFWVREDNLQEGSHTRVYVQQTL